MSLSFRRWITVAICSLLLLGFALVSWFAERTKCATCDEPLHSVAGFVITQDADYRLNPEDPPLWQRWANLAEPSSILHVDESNWRFLIVPKFVEERHRWLKPTLYATPGNDADAFLTRQRLMLIPLGVALGVLIAVWSAQLGGPVAAIAATTLFAMDPNFLAHAAMIKNDVAITLIGFALCYATWRMGRRFTITSAAAVVLLAMIATVIKFSWPLPVMAVFGLLMLRAMLPWPWARDGGEIQKRSNRIYWVLGLLLAVTCGGYVTIWANYFYRFAPAPNGQLWDFEPLLTEIKTNELSVQHPEWKPTNQELQAWRPHGLVKATLFLEQHELLPQTYLYGALYTYCKSRQRPTFVLGHVSNVGSWYYFPLAFVSKMTLASLAAVLIALIVAVPLLISKRSRSSSWERRWTLACLTLPALIFAVADITSNLNIGFRHFLPVMPFVYVGVGTMIAVIWKRWGRGGRALLAALAIGLSIETATAFPDFLAFFNVACGGSTGGLKILGDSNLDWGQDLPLLAQWQRQHRATKLYLSYFGSADPEYYGIHADSIAGDYSRPPSAQVVPTKPGVLAVSATNLQGMYRVSENAQYAELAKTHKPREILGGTIYLYDFKPNQ
jgi:hypothetical protein